MTFARNAAVNGDGWLQGALDKPPLTIYFNAAALISFAIDTDPNGVLYLDAHKGEFAARITGVLVGVVCVAVLMRLAYGLYGVPRHAIMTGLWLALSPYMLAFSPTAFTDMPMMLCSLLALLFAWHKRPMWSGITFMLAVAAKPQAIFFVPLILMFQHFGSKRITFHRDTACRVPTNKHFLHNLNMSLAFFSLCRWLFTALLGGGLLWLWDTLRPETSVFVLGAINNSHATLFSELSDIPARWAVFWQAAQWLIGNAITTSIILIGILLGLISQKNQVKILIGVWLVGYVGLHLVTTLNLYDRYWLLLLPGLILLVPSTKIVGSNSKRLIFRRVEVEACLDPTTSYFSRKLNMSQIVRTKANYRLLAFGKMLLMLALFYAAIMTPLPIGSDRGRYTGIDELADYLNTKPVATVIYDRWLGWQLGYYLGQWTNKRRVHFPTPQALVQGALALSETGTRYLVAPTWENVEEWLAGLRAAHFEVFLETHIAQFAVYAITPPSSISQSPMREK